MKIRDSAIAIPISKKFGLTPIASVTTTEKNDWIKMPMKFKQIIVIGKKLSKNLVRSLCFKPILI